VICSERERRRKWFEGSVKKGTEEGAVGIGEELKRRRRRR